MDKTSVKTWCEIVCFASILMPLLLLARLMGGIVLLVGVCRLSSSSVVVCNTVGRRAGRPLGMWPVGGWLGGRHCTAGQYGYIQLGWHLVIRCRIALAGHQRRESLALLIRSVVWLDFDSTMDCLKSSRWIVTTESSRLSISGSCQSLLLPK